MRPALAASVEPTSMEWAPPPPRFSTVTDIARGGQHPAFDRYVAPEIPFLCRVALSLTGHRADAEDLVQDALVRAFRAADRFDGAHPRVWLLTILRHAHRPEGR